MTPSEASPSFILQYQRIGNPLNRSIARGQYVLPALLRWQLESVRQSGCRALTLHALLRENLTTGHCAVTFDGGYLSVMEQGLPVLAGMGIPATVYVVANLIGGTNWWDERLGDRTEKLLGKRELQALAAAGWEIGSQSSNHLHLTALAPVSLREELRGSKARLEDLLGAPVAGFSYPYGEWDERVRDEVIEAGYKYAVAREPGELSDHYDPFLLPRIGMGWNTVGFVLRRKLTLAWQRASDGAKG